MTLTTIREPAAELDARFSDARAVPTEWADGRMILETAPTYWLSTVREDGWPHVTTIAGVWLDDALHLTTGDDEQKRRNLDLDGRCVVTTGCNGFAGIDVVVEGQAVAVTDPDRLQAVADAYVAKYGEMFPFAVSDDHLALHDGPEGMVRCYRLEPRKAFGFRKDDPLAQTRWRFDAD